MAPKVKGITTYSEGASVAVLLIHGFGASSDELATLHDHLSTKGYSTFSVQLAGHGTTPEDFKATTWEDWYQSAKFGLEHVLSWNTKYVFIVGFSMGGLLSLLLSSEEGKIDGLIAIAPALKIPGFLYKLVPVLKYFMKWRDVDIEAAQQVYDVKRFKLNREPVSAYHELMKLQKVVKRNLGKITIPTIIIQGTDDKTVDPEGAQIIYETISSEKKELYMIEGAEHVISCHPTRVEAYPHIIKFIEEIVG
ncbi:MAG: alpha/beta hydrolase [Candidatus Thorarchaeota archaeon]